MRYDRGQEECIAREGWQMCGRPASDAIGIMGHITRSATTPIVALTMAVIAVVVLTAAELKETAVRAFVHHADEAQQSFVNRAQRAIGQDPKAAQAMRDGDIVAGPGSGDGILDVEGGLVHDWRAQILIPGVKLDQVLHLSRSYPEYPTIFHPVVAAKVLSEDGDHYSVQLRMRESAGGLSATLEVRSNIVYTRVDPRHAFVLSRSEEIHEVKNPNKPSERLLPPGEDNGYLWRARAMTRFVEDDAGVWMEMETLGLSRAFPPMIGWAIEPIARVVGRRSAEASLGDFKRAVLARMGH